jgi:hypothetical protein
MNTAVRTTITMPQYLLEALRTAAYIRKTTISSLVQRGIQHIIEAPAEMKVNKLKTLEGAYSIKGKKGDFSRRAFYETSIQKDMSH